LSFVSLDRHLNEMIAGGDETNRDALEKMKDRMKGRWKHPILGMGWYRAAKRDFAALPEDWRAAHPPSDDHRTCAEARSCCVNAPSTGGGGGRRTMTPPTTGPSHARAAFAALMNSSSAGEGPPCCCSIF
jgi:hypothetical protein